DARTTTTTGGRSSRALCRLRSRSALSPALLRAADEAARHRRAAVRPRPAAHGAAPAAAAARGPPRGRADERLAAAGATAATTGALDGYTLPSAERGAGQV
ncbi:hypothetical protein PINS_up019934, partial [Pythium insidiosum]